MGAHPRSRGENKTISPIASSRAGSSLLTQGKQSVARPVWASRGLIPAHAGKTDRHRRSQSYRRAHPRSRGENRVFPSRNECTSGSSPLTRGKQERERVQALTHGLIPLARGKRKRGPPRQPLSRLIPAHTGKTSSPASPASRHQAHPRSCRENMSTSVAACYASGSSPLTRGKQPRTILGRRTERLIPAHAGKTTKGPRSSASWWAHPHSRGENRRYIQTHPGETGSSPLTRRKLS